ncbi:hypothetical protein Lal_00017271 [Lupinus albus]|nr:hypothetical protein Lal_00017271 [Lupinus albus]
MQNSGMITVAQTLHMSSVKDRNPIYANMSYFGTQQVLYVSDPTNKKLFIVLLTNKIILNNIDDQECEDIDVEDDLFLDIIVA